MLRRYWPAWCVVAVILWGFSATAVAQEGDAEAPPAEEATAEQEAEEQPPAEEGEEQPPAEEGEEQPPPEETGDEEQPPPEETGDEETVEGPGGAPLQTDYPGTEESLQPRMDTGRIEGAEDVPEDGDPQEVYDLRVRELETQIDDLKERVFRSKSRVALLRESVLAENLAGSRAIVTFVNELGRRYNIERAIFSVDGSQVFSSVDPNGEFDEELEIFTGPMTPGTHTVSVTLGLRGSGYGVFSYAEGYEFDLRFSCQFTAEEGRTTLVTVRSYKSGNAFTAHEDRPDGICQVSMVELDIGDFEDDIADIDEDFDVDAAPESE